MTAQDWLAKSDDEIAEALKLGRGGAHATPITHIRELLQRFDAGEAAARISEDLEHSKKWGRENLIKLGCFEPRPASKARGNLKNPHDIRLKGMTIGERIVYENKRKKRPVRTKVSDLPLFEIGNKMAGSTRWNKELRERCRSRYRERYQADMAFRVKELHKRRFKKLVSGKFPGKRMAEWVGMPWEQVPVWLESNFQNGMSWDNFGRWHIDHVAPLSWFELGLDCEARLAWNWRNMRPLWARENISRKDSGAGALQWFGSFEPCEIVERLTDRAQTMLGACVSSS